MKYPFSELSEILDNVLGSLQTAYFIVRSVFTACAVVVEVSTAFLCTH